MGLIIQVLSLVWLQTELDSTQSYYHYLTNVIIAIGKDES